jgi:hypothetical protein
MTKNNQQQNGQKRLMSATTTTAFQRKVMEATGNFSDHRKTLSMSFDPNSVKIVRNMSAAQRKKSRIQQQINTAWEPAVTTNHPSQQFASTP